MVNSLHWLLHTALAYLGKPYIWGGDDPSGFDCSGFVIECLQSAGLLPDKSDYTADSLLQHFRNFVVDAPCAGALLFSLDKNNHAHHVVICLDEHFCIGANSGTSATVNEEDAWKMNAFVKIRPIGNGLGRGILVNPLKKVIARRIPRRSSLPRLD